MLSFWPFFRVLGLPSKGQDTVAAAATSLQSCPTLCDPRDSSPPGSPVPGILQTRTLEWVAISFSNAWKWKLKVKSLSRGRLLATPWTAAYQAPPSMGFARQEYWRGLPLPSPKVRTSMAKKCWNFFPLILTVLVTGLGVKLTVTCVLGSGVPGSFWAVLSLPEAEVTPLLFLWSLAVRMAIWKHHP